MSKPAGNRQQERIVKPKQSKKTKRGDLDLRTPSGRKLPY